MPFQSAAQHRLRTDNGLKRRTVDAIESSLKIAANVWGEDATLADLVRSGHSFAEIADQLQRQPSAIRSRARKRNLTKDDSVLKEL